MPELTITINLTDTELEAFNFLAEAYDETQTESFESYIKQGVRMWLENPEIQEVPKAARLLKILQTEKAEEEKSEEMAKVTAEGA